MGVRISTFCHKDNVFSLCFLFNRKRYYVKVKGLDRPDYDKWSKKEQRFVEASLEAIHNNNVLKMMRDRYQEIIDKCPDITTKEQLVALYNASGSIKAEKITTLGDFLKETINLMKDGDGHNMPSRNFQVYITLLHSLEDYRKCEKGKGEMPTIDKKISEINDLDFENYGAWINKQTSPDKENTNNYIGKMKHFHAIMGKARKKHLTNKSLTYNYRDAVPFNERNPDIKRETLTQKQFDTFIVLDITKIYLGGGKSQYYKELYRDFCILMTELNVRPVDCIKLHWDNISYDRDTKTNKIMFLPEKKKNVSNIGHHMQVIFVQSEIAISIMKKYKGKSKGGYVLPFAMNEHKWNLKDAKEFKRFDNRKAKTLESINSFLKKVQKEMKLKQNLTTYSFRHTGINIAVYKYGAECTAMTAGTSIAMMDKTYVHAETALKNRIMDALNNKKQSTC